MAPTPQELPQECADADADARRAHAHSAELDGERVVISGVSGAFPRARHVKDLTDILYDKVDPIAGARPRWDYDHPEVPQHVGLIPDLELFDAQFFRVHRRLGLSMDPMSRTLLEQTYQAIYDAGVNPGQLSGKKIGVYVGSCLSETEKTGLYNLVRSVRTGLSIIGCNKSMYANRVSYWLNVKGPSMAVDAACCSSTVALEQAYLAIQRGACEAAIVGGCNLCMHPQTSIHFARTITLCKDGKTKCYDQAADGCVRSESVNVLFLQKAKDALRVYADIVFVKSNYVSVTNAGSFKRTPEEIIGFLKDFYDEIKVSPREVEYVEGFGSADPECDKSELEAIDKVFCTGRNAPLNIGSVMSNVGYCESASGIMAIVKVVLGYHKGLVAGNLHYSQPREDVAAIRDGRLRVLEDHTPCHGTYIAVNGLSLSGVNSHVLLHGFYKPKDLTKYQSSIPRLALISGRTDSAVQKVIDDLKSRPIDAEELALIHNIHTSKINGHLGRGFTILDTDEESKTTALCEKAEYFDGGERPLWFVYSGMGSQWAGMGAQLMRIPIFAAAIERCRRVLEPRGLDIVHIITAPDKTIYNNILHSFVGIAAIQIGLTDVLLQLGLVPDKIIGHSVGELGCAYADGCLSAEEMILAAYSRGRVSVETPFIRGSMAAVGIGYEQMSKMCPPEIEVACHNSPDSSTISGPAAAMAQFVSELTAKSIFAKEVPCSNIAYHSRYIAEAGPGLLKYLKEVIKTPKLRSERWVSTSVPQESWNEEIAKYSSAEYHTNNLLNPVLFEETCQLIPRGAVLVEVAPHGLLQAILRRALPACTNVPLTRRAHPDNARFLLEAIGQLFMEGYYPDVRPLYPKVEFPVSTGTPHLSHLVEWAHEQKWYLALYESPERVSTATCTFKISLHDDEYSYLRGHQIRGKTTFPFTSALVCAWDTLAMATQAPRCGLPVTFCDVELHAQPTLHDSRLLRLTVALHRGTGRFEIDDGITMVASGVVMLKKTSNADTTTFEDTKNSTKLKAKEIYQIFSERGYMYREEFRSIREADASFTEGIVSWSGRWAPFLDSLLQLHSLRQPQASQPAFIRELNIDTKLHKTSIEKELKVTVCTVQDSTRCGGVTMKGLRFRHMDVDERPLTFDTSKFTPRNQQEKKIHGESVELTEINKVLEVSRIGDLESVDLMKTPASEGPGIWVKVHFAGLNASDILKSEMTEHCGEGNYGMDFSGTLENGSRVMGVVAGGAASQRVRVRPELLWPVPAHWSLEDAATVPFPYAHALYCLTVKTRLIAGSSILVSGGAGATGQAMIAVALHARCRVFVVVGDASKKQFLMKMYPALNADDIICCRDASFVNRVMPATNGKGCDVVICNRGADNKDAYIQCCAHFGHILDIHQSKINEIFSLKMSALALERSYGTVDFSGLFYHNDIKTFKKLQLLVAEGISSGWVRPLSRVCYSPAPADAARALRLLAGGRHRGRVLLCLDDTPPRADSRLRLNRCQLVVSDCEALGLQLAGRLVRRGARALLLHLEHTSPRLSLALRSWKKMGVHVVTSSEKLEKNQCVSNLLKQSIRLGPLEGVFVVMAKTQENQQQEVYKTLLQNLDAESRKICPSIKYFAVVGINSTIGEQVCMKRASDRLPAMMISVSVENKVEDDALNNLPANYVDIVNGIERGLLTMQPVIFASFPPDTVDSLSQQIEKIAGVVVTNDTANTQTLQELGLTTDKAHALYVFLRDKQNITIPEEKVASLTIEKIREMEATLTESNYAPVHGLSAFFPFVDTDELSATVEAVVMSTLTQSDDMRDDEFEEHQACLFIVPGMLGLQGRYRGLCERLQLAAVVLQPGLDHVRETLQEMAARYLKVILNKSSHTNKFYLLGHELGVLSALEIAAALEDHGMRGTVFCLGGGPDEFLHELEASVAACAVDSEQALQDAVARHMCALMGVAGPQLDAALRDARTWPEKVEASARALRGRVPHSTQYARLLIEAAYTRITEARRYAHGPTPRVLESRVVLLRSPSSAPPARSLALQRRSRLPLAVQDLRAPLAHAADDLRAAALVNRYLDDQTRQDFADKSLCHTFLLNPDSFIDPSGGSNMF